MTIEKKLKNYLNEGSSNYNVDIRKLQKYQKKKWIEPNSFGGDWEIIKKELDKIIPIVNNLRNVVMDRDENKLIKNTIKLNKMVNSLLISIERSLEVMELNK